MAALFADRGREGVQRGRMWRLGAIAFAVWALCALALRASPLIGWGRCGARFLPCPRGRDGCAAFMRKVRFKKILR